jgi:hypothetical protein
MKRCLYLALVAVCLLAMGSGDLFAQATATGTIQGTVVDKMQAVVVGAEVTATNTETGVARTTTTNEAGLYRFELLPVGHYTVKIRQKGFSTVSQVVELIVGRTATADATLVPGTGTEVVEVTAAAPLVDVEKTSVSQDVSVTEVEKLPMLGRDVANLAYLAPGVKPTDSYDPTKNRYAILSVNGLTGRNVNVTVNGIDNKDSTVGGPVQQLPLESVEEFLVNTQRFSAVNGRSEGAAINMVTKAGTNTFHGSVFGFFRDQDLNAIDYFSGKTGTKPPYSRQWFGGSIGGPIKKDKVFAFFAFERQRENTSIPESGDAFTQLSLVAAHASLLPSFVTPPEPASVIPTPFYENRYNGRLDWKFTDHESAYVSASIQANNGENDQSNGFYDLTAGNYTLNHMQTANFTLNSVLSDTLVNSFTFGFQYWNNLIDSKLRSDYITFPGSEAFGTNVNVPQQSFQHKWQWRDDMTKTAGKHTLRWGGDIIWDPRLGGYFEFNPTLEVDFGLEPSAILALPAAYATPGIVTGMTIANGNPDFLEHTKQLGLYFQDDWKVTRRLTLNLGVRWDKDFGLVGGASIPNSRTYLELKQIASISPLAASLVSKAAQDDSRDVSPRIGFAYDLTGSGKHIIRGGYGLYYGNIFQNLPLFMEQQANPTVFQTVFALSSADIVPGTNILLSNYRFGIDPLPIIPPPSGILDAGSIGRLMDGNYRNPVSQQWNAGYQWAVDKNSVIEVEYVHVLDLHQNKGLTTNLIDPATGTRPLAAAFAAVGLPAIGRVTVESSVNRDRYDGANFSYRKRMSQHFSMNATYTLSRAYGWSVNSGSNGNGFGGTASNYRAYPHDPRNPWDPRDFGPTPTDERHHVSVSGIALVPWGFEVSPILQFGSARPYDLNQGYDVLGIGSGYSRPLIVNNSDPTNLFAYDPATSFGGSTDAAGAAARACLAAGQCHQVGYDTVRGDPFVQLDARISKNIKIGEGRTLQLMFQAFDLTNKVNFSNDYFNTATSGAKLNTPKGYFAPGCTECAHSFNGEFGCRFTF